MFASVPRQQPAHVSFSSTSPLSFFFFAGGGYGRPAPKRRSFLFRRMGESLLDVRPGVLALGMARRLRGNRATVSHTMLHPTRHILEETSTLSAHMHPH